MHVLLAEMQNFSWAGSAGLHDGGIAQHVCTGFDAHALVPPLQNRPPAHLPAAQRTALGPLQTPAERMLTPASAESVGLKYVTPSHPQTGFTLFAIDGFGRHVPPEGAQFDTRQ